MSDDVDMAMAYAEERKKRLAVERRLIALLYETMPYTAAVNDLLLKLAQGNMEGTQELLKTLVTWRSDLEINIYLNMIKPVTEAQLIDPAVATNAEGWRDMDRATVDAMQERGLPFAKEVYEEWDKLANMPGTSLLSVADAREKSVEIFKRVIEQTVKRIKAQQEQ